MPRSDEGNTFSDKCWHDGDNELVNCLLAEASLAPHRKHGNIGGMNRETFEQWLAAYGSAWISRDVQRAASLYAEDATYQVTPFDEPFRGRAAIYDYWKGVT